ncbi:MAG: MetQ/NlpA family ABC transporter substrate-binding protein [Tissierellia bacterium]|nr:MetQ/NlpA family ABC transporter substrate-binding protein [Tissierellia bacterium]
MKKILLAITLLALLTTACGKSNSNPSETATEGEIEKIVLGVSATPHGEIVEHLKPQLEAEGLDVEIVTFNDYVQPNLQLDSGDLDANFFQHTAYLVKFNEDRGTKVVEVPESDVFISPIGLYSKNYQSVEELPDGAEIIIPNDPTNGARGLLVLHHLGIIKVDNPDNLNITENDIVDNPKNLKFKAMEAPNIPRVYEDADAAFINFNYAVQGGLDPKTTIAVEDEKSPYKNVVAVREGDENQEKYKKLVKVLRSEECRKFMEDTFEGGAVPTF